ncbi:hypothetical protein I7I50_06288 [Histoplasma capsulatum G186AR]|uniref:Uncharacterized protein n=1 Tax=Ajellomyces capsulatus TaxID=5037 RepID=A0A8H7Z2U2_AJECA|nr:hypothetical protein I7I52_10639 [Histoplasma capsulatum]QSS67267.1 hypothetical protein I7I50_06288 [Histoplasma capsulatum G186AR]
MVSNSSRLTYPVRLNGFGGDGCSVVIGDAKIGRDIGGCIGAGAGSADLTSSHSTSAYSASSDRPPLGIKPIKTLTVPHAVGVNSRVCSKHLSFVTVGKFKS